MEHRIVRAFPDGAMRAATDCHQRADPLSCRLLRIKICTNISTPKNVSTSSAALMAFGNGIRWMTNAFASFANASSLAARLKFIATTADATDWSVRPKDALRSWRTGFMSATPHTRPPQFCVVEINQTVLRGPSRDESIRCGTAGSIARERQLAAMAIAR